jgi:hypothetical protein
MRRLSKEAGFILPLVAVCLAVLMGFAGIAVDVGFLEYRDQAQISATDAAAIGGSQELVSQNCPNPNAATAAADNDAASNGFVNGGNVVISVHNPPTSGPYSGSDCAVSVQITTNHVATFFSRLFGYPQGMTETTSAVGAAASNGSGCIYMLSTSQDTNFNGSTVAAPNCSILLNGTANFSSSTVNAGFIGEANYAGSNNSGTFPGASPAPMLPVADPCSEIPGCAYLTDNPQSTSPCTGSYSGGGTLGPGCYDNLSLNKATVTLQPGLYVLPGASNFNQAAITGNGVTLYIPSGASTNFNKVDSMTLTPQTTGNEIGVTIYQVAANSGDLNLNGSSTSLGGLIYAPTAPLNYNGTQGLYAVVVAAYANFNGSSGEDFATPAPNASLIKSAVLGQ